jgi:hypothetical protein
LLRISFASSSCGTAHSVAFTGSRSALVGPERRTALRSAWRPQNRKVSAVQPIFSAIEAIATHCEA